MKKVFIITLMLLSGMSFGQTAIKKDNISSGGGSNTVGNTTVIYTIGEVVVQENSVGNIHISEGFISPDLLQAFSVEEYTVLEGVSIYPNPSADYINISFENDSQYHIILSDISGKILFSKSVTNGIRREISLLDYPKAVYVLIVKDLRNGKYKVFKVVKK